MAEDPRETASIAVPMVQRLNQAEKLLLIARAALEKVVAGYDQFVSVTTIGPLVKAMDDARIALEILRNDEKRQQESEQRGKR